MASDGKVTITVDLDGTSAQAGVKKLKDLLNGLGDTSSKGFDTGTKSVIGFGAAMGIATKLVSVGMNTISSSIGGAVSRVDTMNRFPQTMKLFGYSAKESKAAIDRLSKGIEGLPTPLDSAVKSAQQLSITTGSLDKGTKLALAFNNAMIGYGANTNEAENALRQFNQSLGSGKIYAEEFNSVSEAAPGLMSKMAESFGFGKNGVADLKDALSKGKITAQEFADKMIELNDGQEGFAAMAQASAGGIATSWQNVKTAVTKGVANIISSWDEAAKSKGLGSIAENINKLKGVVSTAFNAMTPYVSSFVDVLAGVAKTAGKMWESFKETGALTALGKAFDAVKEAVGHVFESFSGNEGTFQNIASALGEVVKWLADAATKGAEFISSLPPGTIQAIAGAVLGAVGAFKGFKTVSGILKNVSTSFGLIKAALSGNPFMIAVVAIGALVGWFIQAYTTSETFRNKVNEVVEVIGKVASKIGEFLSGIDPSIFAMLLPVMGTLLTKFKGFDFIGKFNPFKIFKKNAKDGFDGAGDSAGQSKGIIEQVFSGLGTLITSVSQGISTVLQGLATAISTVAQGFGTAASMANPAQWLSMGAAMLMVGAGVALASAGIYLLVQAAIQLASAGTGAQVAMLALGLGIAVLAGIFALLGPVLTASAVGILAFGAAIALIGAGIALAAVGLAVLVNAFANAEGAITATGQAISTAAQGIGKGIQSALEGAAKVVESVGSAIKSALEGVAKVFESVGKAIESAFKGIGSVVESVGSAIRNVLDGIAGIIDSIGNAALNAGKGFKLLAQGVVMITNTKLGDMAASLGAVALGVGKIAGHSAGLAQAGSGMKSLGDGMRTVSSSASTAAAGLTSFATRITTLQTQVTTLPGILTTAATGFASFTSQAVAGVAGLSAINAPITSFKTQIMTIAPALMMAGASFGSFGAQAMVIGTALGMVGALILAFNAQLTTVSATVTMVGASFASLSGSVLVVASSLTTVSAGFAQIGSSASSASSQLVSISTSTQTVVSAFNRMRGQVQSAMQGTLTAITSTGNQMKAQGRQIGQQTARNIAQGIRGGTGQAVSAMNAMVNAVRSAGMAGVGSMRGIGAMIGQGLAQGMYSALGAVTAAANALVAQAERAAQAKAKIHSPSRLFRDNVGRYISQGVAVGILGDAYKVDDAMGSMYDKIQGFNFKAEDVIGVGKSKLSKVVQVKSDLERAVKATVEVAKEKSNNLLEKALDIAEKAVDRPTEMRLDDGTLVAKTGDKFAKHQAEQTRRENRMRGIIV